MQIYCASRFAYGQDGRPAYTSATGDLVLAIPPNADLKIDVIIEKHLPPLSPIIDNIATYREHIDYVLLRKEIGNRWFKYHDFVRSRRCYGKGVEEAEKLLGQVNLPFSSKGVSDGNRVNSIANNGGVSSAQSTTNDISLENNPTVENKNEPEALRKEAHTNSPHFGINSNEEAPEYILRAQLHDLYLQCLNNLSACYIQVKDFKKAKEICLRLLENDPNNVRGLIRAAKVSLAIHEYEECDACLQRARSIITSQPSTDTSTTGKDMEEGKSLNPASPTSVSYSYSIHEEVKALMDKLRKAKLMYKQKSKKIASNMANYLFKEEEEGAGDLAAGSVTDPCEKEKEKEGEDQAMNKQRGVSRVHDSKNQSSTSSSTSSSSITGDPLSSTIAKGQEQQESFISRMRPSLWMTAASLCVLLISIIVAYSTGVGFVDHQSK